MAESDASESSVLVDLSDQIDAELSEEGGSICRAESVPVQPYRYEPYRLDSDEEATENDQQGEPRPVDMVKNQRIKNKS